MNVCYTCDVAFNSPECPVCQATRFLKEKEEIIALRDVKIEQLEGTVADLDFQLDQARGEI